MVRIECLMRSAEGCDKKQPKKVAKGTTTLVPVVDAGVKVPVELIAIEVAVADLARDELGEVSVDVTVVGSVTVVRLVRVVFDRVTVGVLAVDVATPTKMVDNVPVVPIGGIVSTKDVAKVAVITTVVGSNAVVTEATSEPVLIIVGQAMRVNLSRIVRSLVDLMPVEQDGVLGTRDSSTVHLRAIDRSVACFVTVRTTVFVLVDNG